MGLTHALTKTCDVQRVSDTVAILNHGKLLTYGPIEERLASGEGPVYAVTAKGNTDCVHQRVSALPWVTGIQAQPRPDSTVWLESVSNPEAAEVATRRPTCSLRPRFEDIELGADETQDGTPFGHKLCYWSRLCKSLLL
jgi:hypothetical protein